MTDEVLLGFIVDGVNALRLPEMTAPARTDELWRTTCFELFWKPDVGEAYVEINLSPSTCWAAYAFDGYRTGMRDLILPHDPVICRTKDGIRAALDLSGLERPTHVALTAVIEEADGTKSYWSFAHPSGAPDFHHPDCFALRIPAVA
ncbi:DOMON-like domain-containing protein [Sphingomonas floccifaciens]|uniref:DOMON-like domain-containing protein n=2 Tax=Sphingomonas floccifaciens TaxID=1844115 RepID=A0ABW4NFR3_9SPHN